MKDFSTKIQPSWCKGCANYNILTTIKKTLSKLNLVSDNLAFVYGIGCGGNIADYLKVPGIHALHGRALPVAQGIKIANEKLKVIIIAGDGDTFGIGAGHFIHAARRDMDITLLVTDNHRYALTTGQASPTTDYGDTTRSDNHKNMERPLNPIALALAADASFIARGYASPVVDDLVEIIIEAINHKGFSLVDILQPCISFNSLNTYDWYKKRIYEVSKTDYDNGSKMQAITKSQEWEDKIPIGILYKENRTIKKEKLKSDFSKEDFSQLAKEFL